MFSLLPPGAEWEVRRAVMPIVPRVGRVGFRNSNRPAEHAGPMSVWRLVATTIASAALAALTPPTT